MKQISDVFAARLAADDTTLCACWRFVRIDGAVFGATDHDVELVFDGVSYIPSAGIGSATFESSSGLAPGRATASGVLSLDFISEDDLDAGLWDSARVDVWKVDWRAVEHRIVVWSGRLSEIARRGQAFTAELVSLKADLEKSIGRVYARTCDVDVGDARCGVDLRALTFRGEGVVAAVLSPETFRVSGLEAFAAGWFEGACLPGRPGAMSGRRCACGDMSASRLVLTGPSGSPLNPAMHLTFRPGVTRRSPRAERSLPTGSAFADFRICRVSMPCWLGRHPAAPTPAGGANERAFATGGCW